MKSDFAKATQAIERSGAKMNKKGQLEIANNIVKGILGLVFLILFYFVFTSQMFTSVSLPAGSAELNGSQVVRNNGSAAVQILSNNFGNWVALVGFVIVVILLIIAYRYYNAGAGAASGRGGGY